MSHAGRDGSYSFEDTPLWAGIYMLPLTGGFRVGGRAEKGEAAPRELAANEIRLTEPAAGGALTWDPAMILRQDA